MTELEKIAYAKNFLDQMADGVNPLDGSFIPEDELLRHRRIDGLATPDDADDKKYIESSIGMVGDWRRRGPVYELPYECLFGAKVKNLITAGRNISVTDDMWDITRVIPVCAVTGEAAGIAAAMTDDFAALDVKLLQAKLREGGVKLHCGEVL